MEPIHDTNVTKAEQVFLAVLALHVLLILPMLGAEAMLFGAGAGLVAYALLFSKRLHRRGWLLSLIPITLADLLGAALATALGRGD